MIRGPDQDQTRGGARGAARGVVRHHGHRGGRHLRGRRASPRARPSSPAPRSARRASSPLLQNERTWTVVELIGAETLIQSPVDRLRGGPARRPTRPSPRSATRSAQASDEVEQAYRPRSTTSTAWRSSAARSTATPAPRGLDAGDVRQRHLLGLLRPHRAVPRGHRPCRHRRRRRRAAPGTTLVGRSAEQVEVLANLSRQVVLDSSLGDGINQPAEIAATSQLKDDFDQANEEFLTAPPPFDEVVAASFDHDLVDGFSANVDTALTGDAHRHRADARQPQRPRRRGLHGRAGRAGRRPQRAGRRAQRRRHGPGAALRRPGRRHPRASPSALTWAGVPVDHAAAALADPPGQRHGRPPAARRRHRILDTPLGENVIGAPGRRRSRCRTRDEVSDVADALNTVQDTALDLAVEQAVLRRNIADSFVNLGRRNQNLLGRQLDFITELESNETDPDALSNLFRLDHLATRMRRNAESLLVLAGIEPPRQWAAPVRLTDVIRAALGEVEDYQRVSVRGVEPATIIGSAAADLAHLLAELVENALVFSPPDQNVDIRGPAPPGRPAAYTLAVIDTGLGMAPKRPRPPPTAGWPAPRASPSPRPSTSGTTWPATSPPATASRCGLDTPPARASPPPSRSRPSLLTTDQVTSAPVTPPHGQRAVRARARASRCRPPAPGPGARRRPSPRPRPGRPARAPGPRRVPAGLAPHAAAHADAGHRRGAGGLRRAPAHRGRAAGRPPARAIPAQPPGGRGEPAGLAPPLRAPGPRRRGRTDAAAGRDAPRPPSTWPAARARPGRRRTAPDPARGGGADAAHGGRPAPRRHAGRPAGRAAVRRVHGRHRRAGPAVSFTAGVQRGLEEEPAAPSTRRPRSAGNGPRRPVAAGPARQPEHHQAVLGHLAHRVVRALAGVAAVAHAAVGLLVGPPRRHLVDERRRRSRGGGPPSARRRAGPVKIPACSP